jgi:hypothetical protein
MNGRGAPPINAMSTPPGANGPPSAVHRKPFLRIQASNPSLFSCVNLNSGGATPCKILWLFLVVRKTLGDGFGTYLRTEKVVRVSNKVGKKRND